MIDDPPLFSGQPQEVPVKNLPYGSSRATFYSFYPSGQFSAFLEIEVSESLQEGLQQVPVFLFHARTAFQELQKGP